MFSFCCLIQRKTFLFFFCWACRNRLFKIVRELTDEGKVAHNSLVYHLRTGFTSPEILVLMPWKIILILHRWEFHISGKISKSLRGPNLETFKTEPNSSVLWLWKWYSSYVLNKEFYKKPQHMHLPPWLHQFASNWVPCRYQRHWSSSQSQNGGMYGRYCGLWERPPAN